MTKAVPTAEYANGTDKKISALSAVQHSSAL